MLKKNQNSDDQNFWISYADLMAGLLFVFILLVGAIVVKYVFIQTDLQAIKTDLEKEKKALNLSEDQLAQKKIALEELNERLKASKEQSVRLSFELAMTKNKLEQSIKEFEDERKQNKLLSLYLEDKSNQLKLSNEQIEKITAILEDKQNKLKLLNDELKAKQEIISLNAQEIEKLKQLLLGYELKEKDYINAIENLNENLSQTKNTITLKDEELSLLEEKLLIQSKEHQKIVEEFDIAKVKIKNLTGIRIKVVTALKEKLGKEINIDPLSGALKFSSNILFNQGEYTLKESSKAQLSDLLKKYIRTLLLDQDIKNNIDRIIIEGHTDTKGSYLFNLELSQKRALEVMKFLYELDFEDKKLLEKYIVASGRSYSQAIFIEGIEDKEASRRIEIKFELKNEQAIKEIENFLKNK